MYDGMTKLPEVRKHYNQPHIAFMVDSMIAGNTLAKVYVNDMDDPAVSIIMEGHSAFFGGDALDTGRVDAAVRFFRDVILIPSIRSQLGILKVYPASEAWREVLMEALAEYDPAVYWRSFYRHDLKGLPALREREDGVMVAAIDRNIVEDAQLANLPYMTAEIVYMWGGIEPFLANGFGSCVIQDRQILCWCTGEYVSEKACGIGIETMEPYQGRGIATLAAAHFVRQCAERGMTPHWDSWKANLASVKVAENVGFEKVLDYPILFLKF